MYMYQQVKSSTAKTAMMFSVLLICIGFVFEKTNSENVIGGITTKPSNAFPRSDNNDYELIIFNCTSATKKFPWWTFRDRRLSNNTITNSTCGVNTSYSHSHFLKTETLGPGSCNLIVVVPTNALHHVAGSFVCTDSNFSSATAIMVPINIDLKLTKIVNSSAMLTDGHIMRDEEIRISCNPSFTDQYQLSFDYLIYNGDPNVQMRILRTYWTSQGNFVSSINTSNASSYVMVIAPKDGFIPPYTCNIVCDFTSTKYSRTPVIASMNLSFSTEPVEVLYWPTADTMTLTVENKGKIYSTTLLNCVAAANPPATYTWMDKRNYEIANGPTLTVDRDDEYTCNASNFIGGKYYTQSKSVRLIFTFQELDFLRQLVIILGSALALAVLIIICMCCQPSHKRRQRKPDTRTSKDVNININVLNPGNEYDRRQRGGGDNNIYDFPDEGYDNIDTPHRPLPDRPKPGFYEKLKTRK